MAVFLVAGFATILPLTFLLMGSVMNLYGHFEIERVWSLRHWGVVLGDPGFLRAWKNTLILGFATMIVAVVAYSLIAYVIARLELLSALGV